MIPDGAVLPVYSVLQSDAVCRYIWFFWVVSTGPMPYAPYTPPLPGSRNSTRGPLVRGEGAWAEPVKRAKALAAKLTLEEKVNLTTGNGTPCVFMFPIPRFVILV